MVYSNIFQNRDIEILILVDIHWKDNLIYLKNNFKNNYLKFQDKDDYVSFQYHAWALSNSPTPGLFI